MREKFHPNVIKIAPFNDVHGYRHPFLSKSLKQRNSIRKSVSSENQSCGDLISNRSSSLVVVTAERRSYFWWPQDDVDALGLSSGDGWCCGPSALMCAYYTYPSARGTKAMGWTNTKDRPVFATIVSNINCLY